MSNKTTVAIIIALVVLVGAYYLITQRTDTTPASDTTLVEEIEEVADDAAMPRAENFTLTPDETNTTVAQSGTVSLEETDAGLVVTLQVSGYESEVPQPAHIHTGACPQVGGVVYPLESVVNGTSRTVLADATLEDLEGQLPLAVNVHKSAEEVSVYTSCANLEL